MTSNRDKADAIADLFDLYEGNTVRALLDVADAADIAVCWEDRQTIAGVLRMEGPFTDPEWRRLRNYLDDFDDDRHQADGGEPVAAVVHRWLEKAGVQPFCPACGEELEIVDGARTCPCGGEPVDVGNVRRSIEDHLHELGTDVTDDDALDELAAEVAGLLRFGQLPNPAAVRAHVWTWADDRATHRTTDSEEQPA